jgi:hypothetical protein
MDLLVTAYFQLFEIGKVPHGTLLDMLNIPSNPNIGRIRIPAILAKVASARFEWARSPVRPTRLGSFQP